MAKLAVTIGGKTRMLEISGREGRYSIHIDGALKEVELLEVAPGHYSLRLGTEQRELFLSKDKESTQVHLQGASFKAEVQDARRLNAKRSGGPRGPMVLKSGMPGKVARVLVSEGQKVKAGDGILVIEAMKMENEVKVSYEAIVEAILVAPGQLVETGALMVRFKPPA